MLLFTFSYSYYVYTHTHTALDTGSFAYELHVIVHPILVPSTDWRMRSDTCNMSTTGSIAKQLTMIWGTFNQYMIVFMLFYRGENQNALSQHRVHGTLFNRADEEKVQHRSIHSPNRQVVTSDLSSRRQTNHSVPSERTFAGVATSLERPLTRKKWLEPSVPGLICGGGDTAHHTIPVSACTYTYV